MPNKDIDRDEKDEQEEFLLKIHEGPRRYSAVTRAVQYFGNSSKPDSILNNVLDWNEKQCQPPFHEMEIKAFIQFFLQDNFLKNQIKHDPKSQKLYDVIRFNTGLTLFHDQDGVSLARVKIGESFHNLELGSSAFLDFARHSFFAKTKKLASDQQLKECISLMMLEARADGIQYNLYDRVSTENEHHYYDLCNSQGDVVVVTKDGWSLASSDETAYKFRTGLSVEQVIPERGGDLKDFLEFLNLSTEDEKIIYLSTLPVRLLRNVSQAIAYIHGPASSGKTTLLKLTKSLLDPSRGGISIPVRKPDDILPLLAKSWVFCNDNISKISDEMSDFLCTLATGGESSRRQLYTNGGVFTFTIKNPAFLTGINVEASRSDLLSRMILFKTVAVSDGKRMSDEEMWSRFEEMKPKLLGAIFDTLSKAMQIKPTLKNKTNFRMADFALWGAACAEVLGYGAERFEEALKRAMKSRAYDAVYSSNAGRILLDFLHEHSSFEGTATELLSELKKFRDSNKQYDYDKIANSPNGLSKKLRQLENSLLEIGIQIDFDSRSSEKRLVKITTKWESVPSEDTF